MKRYSYLLSRHLLSRHLLALVLALLFLPGCEFIREKFNLEKGAQLPPLPAVPGEVRAQLLWRYTGAGPSGPLPQRMGLALVPDSGRLYANDDSGNLLALEVATGKRIWRRPLKVETHASLDATATLLVLGTTEGKLLAQSAEDGSELWRAELSSEILAPPRISAGVVLTRTLDGKLFAHEASGGGELWNYESKVPALTLRGTSSPEVNGEYVYSGLDTGKLLALQLGNGALLWESTVACRTGAPSWNAWWI